jgi:hypothetical protein
MSAIRAVFRRVPGSRSQPAHTGFRLIVAIPILIVAVAAAKRMKQRALWGAEILITQAELADLQAKRNFRHPQDSSPISVSRTCRR